MAFHFPFSRTIQNYVADLQFKKEIKDWTFSSIKARTLKVESKEWEKNYLPINLSGKSVLDIGAGEGETAKFFHDHGAARVICIECSNTAIVKLRLNAKQHQWIKPLHKHFELSDLGMQFDFMKMDIEGYEEILLQTTLEKSAVIEVHGLPLIQRFRDAGYRVEYNSQECRLGYGCTAFAYWDCYSHDR